MTSCLLVMMCVFFLWVLLGGCSLLISRGFVLLWGWVCRVCLKLLLVFLVGLWLVV